MYDDELLVYSLERILQDISVKRPMTIQEINDLLSEIQSRKRDRK